MAETGLILFGYPSSADFSSSQTASVSPNTPSPPLNTASLAGVNRIRTMKAIRWIPLVTALAVVGFAVAQSQTPPKVRPDVSTQDASLAKGGKAHLSEQGKTLPALPENVKITRPTHVIVYSPNPLGSPANASRAIWSDQSVYWKRQEERGKLLYSGPWIDGQGALMVLNCENDADAQDIADQDPVVKVNLFLAHVRGWNVSLVGRAVLQLDRQPK